MQTAHGVLSCPFNAALVRILILHFALCTKLKNSNRAAAVAAEEEEDAGYVGVTATKTACPCFGYFEVVPGVHDIFLRTLVPIFWFLDPSRG